MYAKYITCSYKKGKIADVEKAKQYVTEKNSSKKAEKYLKANVRFNELLNDIEQKDIFIFLWMESDSHSLQKNIWKKYTAFLW